MPHTETPVSRRRVLLGTAALALLGGAVSACGSTPQRDPALDILGAELDRARSDSRLAAAAATGVPPQWVPALTSVAALRDAHARAPWFAEGDVPAQRSASRLGARGSDRMTRLTDHENGGRDE